MDYLVWLRWISCITVCLLRSHVKGDVYAYPGKSGNLTTEAFRDRGATFGADLPQQGLEGILTETIPRNACTPIKYPRRQFDGNVWFALIEEAQCSYSHQAMMAQQAGFRAIIVYSTTSEELIVMNGGPEAKSIYIPAVYVGKSAGEALKQYKPELGCGVLITPNIKIPLQLYLIPFAIVIGVCFLFMCIFTIARFFRYRIRQRRNRLSPANLKKIPTKKFRKGDLYDVCAICLDEYEDGDKLRVLRCGHAYHCRCVDPWLTRGKRQCPVCKRSVVSDKPSTSSGPRTTSVSIPSQSSADESHTTDNEADEHTPLIQGDNSNNRSHGSVSSA